MRQIRIDPDYALDPLLQEYLEGTFRPLVEAAERLGNISDETAGLLQFLHIGIAFRHDSLRKAVGAKDDKRFSLVPTVHRVLHVASESVDVGRQISPTLKELNLHLRSEFISSSKRDLSIGGNAERRIA